MYGSATGMHKISPEFIVLDVSGVCYRLMKKKTRRFQSSLFYRLLCGGDNTLGLSNPEIVWLAPNRFFVQRSPTLFEIVLQYYISGKLHLPNWACKESIAEELAFWNLKPEHLCSTCCDKEHYDDDDDDSEYIKPVAVEKSLTLTNGVTVETSIERRRTILLSKWRMVKWRLWTFCERPRSSNGALIFAIVSMLFVVISILNLIVGSVPSLQYCPSNTTNAIVQNQNDSTNKNDSFIILSNVTSGNNSIYEKNNIDDDDDTDDLFGLNSVCYGTRIFVAIDLICIIFFTIEIVLHFLACPTVRQFFTTPMNYIDILATFPCYIEIILWAIDQDSHSIRKAHTLLYLLRVLRTVRVLRILKLARYSRGLRTLAVTLRAAKNDLFILFSAMILCIIIFSCIIYQFEKDTLHSSFTSIPETSWWCVATLTLVGYGDLSPKTVGGKVVASVACFAGVFMLAFPISIFVEHFTAAYKNQSTMNILKMRSKNRTVIENSNCD